MPRIEPFEKYPEDYEQWFERNTEQYRAELEAIRGLLPGPGNRGLEVGVGSGRFAAPLGIQTGVEPSEKIAAMATDLGIDVIQGTAEALPFPDGEFDFVLMVTTICFVDDVRQSFTEASRVLKNGGCLIVGFVDKESEIGRRYAEKKETSRFYRDAVFFSTREVLERLSEAGFEIARIRQTLIPGESSDTISDGFGRGCFVAIEGNKVAR